MDPRDDPRSWHKGRGWVSQLDRVIRWHQRAVDVLNAGEDGGMDDADWDFVYAFFINAYHSGDWMIADGAESEEQWHDFVKKHFALGLCRDLCNGVKHRRLNQRATVDPSPWTLREYVAATPRGGERWHVRAGDDKEFYLMTDLLNEILALLKSYTFRARAR